LSTSGKIRVLLAILCATLFLTAIIVKKTYSPVNNLEQPAKTLESNLHKKEAYINEVLDDKTSFNQLKTLAENSEEGLKYIQRFTTDKGIWFITLSKGRLSFWSGIKVIPEYPASIKDGYSFRKEPNGYYEVIKKSEGNFSAIFFIPVKLDYAFQNQYLQNTFAADLLKDNNIEIADFTDKNVYEIHSSNGSYLFSVIVKPGEINLTFFYYELTIWLLTLISLCVLVHNICNYIAGKDKIGLSLLVLAAFIILVRFVNLHYGWPDFTYKLKIFDPLLYASSSVYPSLGDFCLNILFVFWFVVFLHTHRKWLIRSTPGKISGYLIFIGATAVLIAVSTALLNLFYGLVINSKINFDVSNVLNLSVFSMLGLLMLCFSFLIFYLLTDVFLTIAARLPIPGSQQAILFISSILLTTAFVAYHNAFTLFYILWAALIFIRAYAHRYKGAMLGSGSLSVIILICALISSIKLNYFESVKERATRKLFIQKLQVPDDAVADLTFKRIEKQIISDSAIIRYFKDTLHSSDYIKTRLQKLYFNGYLSKYELKVHEFDARERPLAGDHRYELADFKDMVIYSSYKVSEHFYRQNESFGFLNYFAILPLVEKGVKIGTVVIELQTKPLQQSASFPGLLIDGREDQQAEFKGYSYAFYSDNKLLSQNGNYNYRLVNTEFRGPVKKYTFTRTRDNTNGWYLRFSSFSHLIYRPSERNLVVVTREENPLFFGVTSITFFFVIFLLFSVCVLTIRWLWARIRILTIKNDRIKWNFKINPDLILYKTRIQFSMVFAVVFTLVLVGFITFFSISTQFESQQDRTIKDKITKIAAAFESGPFSKFLTNAGDANVVEFDDFANTYSADLILFDLDGMAIVTTQPRIYEFGLQSRRMNARAFINLAGLKKSQYLNNEIIGKLNYKAAFVPIQNSKFETIAYLELPYFSNELDYKERIGSLLNIMINVYAIVFIAIGLFAVFVARQITTPLSFIQHSLSKTIYGKKNEPIRWDRDDEIGSLVKEYNKMIAALEQSAQKLAQSERESAWREMAKQVAHEIKNPLTPLKLGLQLLDKSWKDKDPKFDQKFERFSKSFVEQIESLSSIASEFSAFAKMPDTKLERLNIFEILTQAVTIFKEMDNIKLLFQAPQGAFIITADRDQLLRCFNNLLKNAIEATPSDRLGIIEINYMVTNKSILLTFKDNGEGIPEHLREKIFEPNFTTKSSGTGLGLAFVKNSIENAGGKVWFETEAGNGTTFYLSLPAANSI